MNLSDAQKQRVSQYTIISGVRQGISGAAILRTLQAVGLGYRTANFYQDYNRYLNIPSRLPNLSAEQKATFVPQNYITSVPARVSNRYQYIFNVPIRLNSGQVRSPNYISYVSSSRLSPDVVLNNLMANTPQNSPSGVIDYTSATLSSVYRYYSEI